MIDINQIVLGHSTAAVNEAVLEIAADLMQHVSQFSDSQTLTRTHKSASLTMLNLGDNAHNADSVDDPGNTLREIMSDDDRLAIEEVLTDECNGYGELWERIGQVYTEVERIESGKFAIAMSQRLNGHTLF